MKIILNQKKLFTDVMALFKTDDDKQYYISYEGNISLRGDTTYIRPEWQEVTPEEFIEAVRSGCGVKFSPYEYFYRMMTYKPVKFIEVRLDETYTAQVYKDKVVVNCTTFDSAVINKLKEALDKVNKQ